MRGHSAAPPSRSRAAAELLTGVDGPAARSALIKTAAAQRLAGWAPLASRHDGGANGEAAELAGCSHF